MRLSFMSYFPQICSHLRFMITGVKPLGSGDRERWVYCWFDWRERNSKYCLILSSMRGSPVTRLWRACCPGVLLFVTSEPTSGGSALESLSFQMRCAPIRKGSLSNLLSWNCELYPIEEWLAAYIFRYWAWVFSRPFECSALFRQGS